MHKTEEQPYAKDCQILRESFIDEKDLLPVRLVIGTILFSLFSIELNEL